MIGVMAAMIEELECYLKESKNAKKHEVAGREYYELEINSKPAIVVLSGIGKVAAASTATTLIHKFGVSKILFTGVAGSISEKARIGDLVVGEYAQHDLDASPFFQNMKYHLAKTRIKASESEMKAVVNAAVLCE